MGPTQVDPNELQYNWACYSLLNSHVQTLETIKNAIGIESFKFFDYCPELDSNFSTGKKKIYVVNPITKSIHKT